MSYIVTEKRNLSASIDLRLNRSYERVIQVRNDPSTGSDPEFGPIAASDAWQASDLWAEFGSEYVNEFGEHDDGAILCGIEFEPSDPKWLTCWLIKLSYKAVDPELIGNPLGYLPVALYEYNKGTRIADQDVNGNMVVNSAGEPFSPGYETPLTTATLTIRSNETSNSASANYALQDVVNSDTWFGFPANTLRCVSIVPGEPQWSNLSGRYWSKQYVFEISPLSWGWSTVVLDAGMNKLVSGSLAKITYNGVPVDRPVPLNGSGGVLAVGGSPTYKTFNFYNAVAFTSPFPFTTIIGI